MMNKDIELYYHWRPMPSVGAIQAINTTSVVDGVIVVCSSVGAFFLKRDSVLDPDNITVIKPTTGPGRWIRMDRDALTSIPSSTVDNLIIGYAGQTAFTLSKEPSSDSSFWLTLNGNVQTLGVDYNRIGTTLTWLNPLNRLLIVEDSLIARYNTTGVSIITERSVFYIGTDYNATIGAYRARSIDGAGSYRFTFWVPKDFVRLVSLSMLGQVSAGVAGPNKNIDITSEYSGKNQASNFYTQSDTTSLYDFTGKQGQNINVLNIAPIFTNLAPLQSASIFVDHKTIGGPIYYYGIEMIYLTV